MAHVLIPALFYFHSNKTNRSLLLPVRIMFTNRNAWKQRAPNKYSLSIRSYNLNLKKDLFNSANAGHLLFLFK